MMLLVIAEALRLRILVGTTGFEPVTSRLSAGCSSQTKLRALSNTATWDCDLKATQVRSHSSSKPYTFSFRKLGRVTSLENEHFRITSSNLEVVLANCPQGTAIVSGRECLALTMKCGLISRPL